MVRAYLSQARSMHSGSCARRHFYRLFSVFFSLQLHPNYVCTDRDIVRARICTERDTVGDPAPSRDRNVAALRADVVRLCCRLPLSPRWPLRRSRNRARQHWQKCTASFRCWKYPLFHRLFPCHLLLRFHAALGLDFYRCRRQLQRLSRSEPNLSRRCVLALYRRVPCPPRVYRWDIVAPRIRNVCSRHAASSGFIPSN